ncbi:MAG TPA: hypothetical protein VF543_18920 [Pyrinomonadaceae bacterium]
MNYCLTDGTPLVKEPSPQGAQPTLVLPAFQSVPNRQVQDTTPYQSIEHQSLGLAQPSQAVSSVPSKRSATLWLIGGVILLLGGVGIGLFVAYVIFGAGNTQSASAVKSSGSSNSSVSQNSNNNQTQSNASPGPPYAAFADRTGLYKGKALNTTSNTRGTINLDITTINADTGYVSSMLTSGGNLCGDAPLTGKLTEEGKMNLSGTLTCKVADYTAPMTVRCRFTTSDTLNCTYSLTNPKYTPATQQGNFTLIKE